MTAIVSADEFGLTYASVHSREFNIRIIEIHRNIMPTMEEQTQDIPGMIGELYLGMNLKSRPILVDIELVADSHKQRNDLIQQIYQWLKPVGDSEYELIFDDQSDYVYYAHVSNVDDLVRSLYKGKATITFTCSDPKAYGEYQSYDITTNPVSITPDGLDECYPIFTCIPSKDVTQIALSDEDGNYIYIGEDVDPDTGDSPVDKEPRVLHDICNNLANWEVVTKDTLTFVLENGSIGGSAKATANTLRVSDFGSHVSGNWHGPVLKQMLPSSYSDWRVRARFINAQSYPRAMGKIELYLLDPNGTRIGKLMLKDNGTKSEIVYAQAQVGYDSNGEHKDVYYGAGTIKKGKTTKKTVKTKNGTTTVTSGSKSKTVQQWRTITLEQDSSMSTFTDFYGYIQLQKVGNKYTVEIMELDDNANPKWSKPITATWTDTKNEYTKKLAGIALYMAKYDITEDTTDPITSYKNNDLALCDVQVWNIIDGGNGATSSPTYIARAGDEIKINTEDGTVYKNGAIFMEHLYIGSKFPVMQGGVMKTFAFEPNIDEAEWYYEYRPTR